MINRQNVGMWVGALLVCLLLWVLIIWGASRILADAAVAPRVVSQSHPLDCIHWRVVDNGGAGPLVRVLVCSSTPKDQGGDSPARDSTNWATLIVDGDAFTTQGCGRSWTAGAGPCVVEGP